MQNLLLNKLNAAIANVEAGKYKDAANQLRNDILPKMGGVENAEGDSAAWIIDRSAQRVWYQGVGNGTVVTIHLNQGVSNNLYGHLI